MSSSDSLKQNLPNRHFIFLENVMGNDLNRKKYSPQIPSVRITWPLSLQTHINIILSAFSPKYLLWGSHVAFFYNDAFSEGLGKNKNHAAAIDLPAKKAGLSKIKSLNFDFAKEYFYCADYIKAVIAEYEPLQLQYNFKLEADDNLLISANRIKITQVIIYFLSNAIRYVPNNYLKTISCKVIEAELKFIVQDFDIGISNTNQKKCSNAFLGFPEKLKQYI